MLFLMIELAPDNPDTYYGRGRGYVQPGVPEQAIKLNPSVSHYYLVRGNAHMNSPSSDQALADYTQAISLNPAKPENYYA